MKKIIYGALIGLMFAILMISVGAGTGGAPILTYVYSNSMEPLIKVKDAFLVLPVSEFIVGDIITYRPTVLKAPLITHRIIAAGENGYITKGDNSPYPDQESGEPEVSVNRIVGKVVTVHGQPLIIPGLGYLSSGLQKLLGKYAAYLSEAFLLSGILVIISGSRHKRRYKARHRWRLRHLYRAVTVLAVISVIISIYAGSRVSQVKYLISEYPGSQTDRVEVNKPGQLNMKISNNGLIPVWTVLKGVTPLNVIEAPIYLKPHSSGMVIFDVLPQRDTGMYQGYVQQYYYPILLPRVWMLYLHKIDPVLAVFAEGLTLGVYFMLLFRIINHIHGLEDWIPLRTMKDKLFLRRMKRARAIILGKNRIS